METERSLMSSPERLPQIAAQCHTLDQWLDLVKGLTQQQVADVAGVKQPRISAIVCGHLPRKTKWPALLKGFGLEGQEAEFYRMVMNARKLRTREQAIQTSPAETPLFDPNQNPAIETTEPVIVPISAVQTSAVRAQA